VVDAPANGAADDGSSDASRVNGRGSEADAGRLVEEEALQRLTALDQRMAEMEVWFNGVKSEAERERKMREQLATRLSLTQERLDRSVTEVTGLRSENAELRNRLDELKVAQEEAKSIRARGGNGAPPALLASATLSGMRRHSNGDSNPLGIKMHI